MSMEATREMDWTIEPHGDGLALYAGRDNEHHGLNLVYLREPAHQWPVVKPMIEAAPDMLDALKRCAAILPRYGMRGSTTGEDEELHAVLETVTEAIAKATSP